jgi:hypothetical protein
MTVTAVRKDPQALTMTVDAEFDASPERVWQLCHLHQARPGAGQPRRVPHDRSRG